MQVVKLHVFCWVLFHSVSTGAVDKKEKNGKKRKKKIERKKLAPMAKRKIGRELES